MRTYYRIAIDETLWLAFRQLNGTYMAPQDIGAGDETIWGMSFYIEDVEGWLFVTADPLEPGAEPLHSAGFEDCTNKPD